MAGRRWTGAIGAAALALAGAAWAAPPLSDLPLSDLPLPELMGHVFQRNAEQLWAWTGIETDASGDHSGAPRNDEQWEQAESDALTLHQLTYVLQGHAARPDDPRWDKLIGDLRQATAASAAAAERKDFAGLSAAGDAINAACVACHWAFAPQLETPPPPVPLPRS